MNTEKEIALSHQYLDIWISENDIHGNIQTAILNDIKNLHALAPCVSSLFQPSQIKL